MWAARKKSNVEGVSEEVNKIRDLFKVKLYTIRSETKKRKKERETEKNERQRKKYRERDLKYLSTLILTGGHK